MKVPREYGVLRWCLDFLVTVQKTNRAGYLWTKSQLTNIYIYLYIYMCVNVKVRSNITCLV